MTDWPTVSSLATAGGTLVLAVATFAAVRSGNQSARTAERALRANLRPLLFPSRLEDPPEKVMWIDRHWSTAAGGHAVVDVGDEAVYLVIALRNVGPGIAVLHGWYLWQEWQGGVQNRPEVEDFRRQTRDLFVPAGATGFWQGAVRGTDGPDRAALLSAIADQRPVTIDLLYGDLEGGQRIISRFGLTPVEDGRWLAAVVRHWHLDQADPR